MGSTSDVTWNQIQHYQEPGSVSCYEHNSWDSSEGMHPYIEEKDKKGNNTIHNKFIISKT